MHIFLDWAGKGSSQYVNRCSVMVVILISVVLSEGHTACTHTLTRTLSLSLTHTHTHTHIHTNAHTHTHTELPGAPELESISTSTESLMIQVTISDSGTPPILTLVIQFSAPEVFARNFTGPFTLGETYDLEVTGLRDNTQYSFTLTAVNYQGRGTSSPRYNSTTGKYHIYQYLWGPPLLRLLSKGSSSVN